MFSRNNTNQRGVTLLEVLISMLILTFGILGLAPMLVLSVESNSISRDFSLAAQLAKEDCRPISDLRASAEYRKEMSCTLVKRALMKVG